MFRWSRSSKLYFLVALPLIFAACTGEPTGLGDSADGAGSVEDPGPSSRDEGDANGASSGPTGSEDSGGSEAGGSEEGGGDDGEETPQPVGDRAAGYARVLFTQSGGLASALLADVASRIHASVASGKFAGLSEEQIESIEFSLAGVQFHRLGAVKSGEEGEGEEATGEEGGEENQADEEQAEETEDGGPSSGVSGASWVTLELAEGTTLVINFTELPPEETLEAEASANGSGLEIAAGELPAGTYKNVRLLGEATITLSEDLTMGNAEFVAGEPYPLEIPSSESSGVKVQTPKFPVDEGGTTAVTLVFDGPASIKKIKLNPGGAKMVPVMRANVEVGTTEAPESPAP
jgi:hypothetical protein